MADSKRLKILKALTALIENVSVSEGFQNDLVGNVFRGRATFGNSDPIPLISILENPKPEASSNVSGESKRKNKQDWHLIVQGFVQDDKENPTDPAHALMADVKKILGRLKDDSNPAHNLGGLVTGVFTDGGVVRPPDEYSQKAYFYLRLVVQFVEDETDPYS